VDTTPSYRRPTEERLDAAMLRVFPVFEYILPEMYVAASLLVRAIIEAGSTTAEATWAIHELHLRGGLKPFSFRSVSLKKLVSERNQRPGGLKLAGGSLHISGNVSWRDLVFAPDHEKLREIELSIAAKGETPENPEVSEPREKWNREFLRWLKGRHESIAASGIALESEAREFLKTHHYSGKRSACLLKSLPASIRHWLKRNNGS
jgi:hypothetical protein